MAHLVKAIAASTMSVGALTFALMCWPAHRQGMPGQLAAAQQEGQSAARSAALALRLWSADRSTRQLASVQVSDAREAVVGAYQDVAQLRANDAVGLDHQCSLLLSLNTMTDDLTMALAALNQPATRLDSALLAERLVSAAHSLDQ